MSSQKKKTESIKKQVVSYAGINLIAYLFVFQVVSIMGCVPGDSNQAGRRAALSPAEAKQRVEAWCMQNGYFAEYASTPPLPCTWPPAGDGRIAYYLYQVEAMTTGEVQYRVYAPSIKLELDIKRQAAQPIFSKIPGGQALGTIGPVEPDPDMQARLAKAEIKLFDLAGHKASAPDRAGALEAYLDYLNRNSLLGPTLKQKAPEFFNWLEKAK